MVKLRGRVPPVTGAGQGIGRATGLLFARAVADPAPSYWGEHAFKEAWMCRTEGRKLGRSVRAIQQP